MPFLFAAVTLVLSFAGVLGAPSPLLTVKTFSGEIKLNSFIVTLKHGADKTAHLESLQPHLTDSQVTHNYDSNLLNAFAGSFSEETLKRLRASPDVEHIEEDGILRAMATVTQTNAPWGLSRLSQTPKLTGSSTAVNFSYSYDSTAGAGVDIYGIGIFTGHTDFGDRARWGATFCAGCANADGNGHGTHTAATAAGTRWGVAKGASVIAVKVLSDTGSGTISDIISGLNFVLSSATASGRPSIAIMSLGGGVSQALDDACTNLVNNGISVTVAAGGSNADAANTSPARAPRVITVGASTFADGRLSFSNFGAVVDIFAPGEDVTSAWIGSPNEIKTFSGTSVSTPHVAGLIAFLLPMWPGPSPAPPEFITNQLHALGTDNILTGIPAGTTNELLRNNI